MTYAQELNKQFQKIQDAFASYKPPTLTGVPKDYLSSPRSYTATSGVDSAVLDPLTGLYKSKQTGAIWNGDVLHPDGTVGKAQNGKLLQMDAYGNPLPVLTTVATPKQPAILSANSALLNTKPADTSLLTKSFDDYLNQAKALNAQGSVQLTQDQAAVDPTETINRLNTGAANTTKALNDINRNYTVDQKKVLGDVANANKDAAAKSENRLAAYEGAQRGIAGDVSQENVGAKQTTAERLAKLKADLDSENAQYETAAQNVAAQAWDKARQGLSLYQLGSGTPTSGSGNLSNRAIRAYTAINVPLQQELANRRYVQTGALDSQQAQANALAHQDSINELAARAAMEGDLTNRGSVVDREAYQNLIAQLQSEGALNSDVANRNYSTAQYTGNLDATTAMQIQQLKNATAGMSRTMAAQYLQQLQIPISLAQQVLGFQLDQRSRDINNLGQIQQIDERGNYYTVNTPYDASRVPATPSYGSAMPSRNYTPASVNSGGRSYSPTLAQAIAAGQPATPAAPAYGYTSSGAVRNYAPAPAKATLTTATAGGNVPAGTWANTLRPVSGGSNVYTDPATGNLYKVVNGQILAYN